jgi:hypothetical protein
MIRFHGSSEACRCDSLEDNFSHLFFCHPCFRTSSSSLFRYYGVVGADRSDDCALRLFDLRLVMTATELKRDGRG